MAWYDIDISFDMASNGDIKHDLAIPAIENSIGNIFRTLPSTRRPLYPFASPTYYILFEQIDEISARRLGRELLQAIKRWENRIVAEGIHIEAKPDDNMYIVQLTYRVVNEGNVKYTYTDILRAI